MSIEHNKAVVRSIFTDVNDSQQYQLLDELCHGDVQIHDPIAGQQRGVEAFRGLFAFFRQGFGEQRTDLEQFVAEGDFVAILHIHNARHTGTFMGAEPTDNWIVVPGLELFRLHNGKIAYTISKHSHSWSMHNGK